MKVDGQATRIAAYKAGEVWIVNASGCVYQRTTAGKWERRADPGTANDIAVGSDGSVWITTSSSQKDKGIHLMCYDFSHDKFLSSHCLGGSDLSVDASGHPLVVLENGELIFKQGAELQQITDAQSNTNVYARDVGIGGDAVWIVGEQKNEGGYAVFRGTLSGTLWEQVDVYGCRIAALT